MFGWCASNQHQDCIEKYQRFYVADKKRKKISQIVTLDEWRHCDCHCHNPVPVKKTTRKPRRKK